MTIREPGEPGDRLPAKTLVQQEMLRRGVLFNGSNFISVAHTDDDVEAAIDAYGGALGRLADGLPDGVERLLEGRSVEPAFRPV